MRESQPEQSNQSSKDNNKTKKELLEEISELTERIKALEASELKYKSAENALFESRQMLQLILDTIPQRVFWKDRDLNYLGCNMAFAKDAGLEDPALFIGKNDYDFWQDIAQTYRDDDWAVIESGTPKLNYEEMQRRPDNTLGWLRTSKVPLRDKNGNVIGLLGSYEDITESKKAQEALHLERTLLRTVIDNTPDAFYAKDTDCKKTIANYVDLQNMGRTSEAEVLGKTDFEFFPYEIAQGFYNDDKKVLEGNTVINREEYIIGDNGEKRWLLTSKIPVKDKYGVITGIVGIGRDITQRKKAEEALQVERNLFKTLIDNMPDLIFFKDAEGRYVLNNRAHLKYLGVKTQEEALGKTIYDFKPKDIADKFSEDEKVVLLSGEPIIGKEDLAHKNGDEYWHKSSKVPLKDNNGKIIGILGVSHDITVRRKAEESLKQTNEALEKTNIDLQKANKVKSQFLANMSHEIRTPLNAIIGFTGLLLKTELNEEQKDFVETINSSGDILLSLINDILDFSKIEAQKIELEKQPFDVRLCIEEALDLVASKAADKNLELLYSIDDVLTKKIIGDVTRLRQIIVNLLSNAIKFTEKGEVIVKASGQLHDNNVYQLQFSVKDTGLGIPMDRQNRLFQSFYQVDASTTRKFGGTGLGLAISKQLCELMGGKMWVESTGVPGEGTTFLFTILAEISSELIVEDDLTALSGKRLLIVDDNTTNQDILIRQTKAHEMIPVAVSSGAEALALINKGEIFDLAILDFHMPEMDGITLAKEIRKTVKGKLLPLVLLSSYGYWEKNNLSQFSAILTKPLKASLLYNALMTVLNQNNLPRQQKPITPDQFDTEIGHNHPLRILLAEDNLINQKVAIRFLEKIGYTADIAFNGIEVIEALTRQTYDVILMDVQMPEMDGETATIEIRKLFPGERQPRIIAMTANALNSDRDRYLSIGMNSYIVKPFKMEELVKALLESKPLAI